MENFKEWLEVDEKLQQEGWKDWVASGLMGLTGLGIPAYQAYKYLEPDRPSVAVSSKYLEPEVRNTAGSPLRYFGVLSTFRIRSEQEGAKIDAARNWAKNHFNVSDADIHVVKAEDYIKSVWGDKWEEVKKQAQGHASEIPGMPDINKLDEPVVLVKYKDPIEKKTLGTCIKFGTGNQMVAVCSVTPEDWGQTSTSREELTHSMQKDVQGQLRGNAAQQHQYAAKTEEFVAKLAELKRLYYQQTGQVSQDAKTLFDWSIRNFKLIDDGVAPIIYLYVSADEEERQRIVGFANSVLKGLVRTSGSQSSGIA